MKLIAHCWKWQLTSIISVLITKNCLDWVRKGIFILLVWMISTDCLWEPGILAGSKHRQWDSSPNWTLLYQKTVPISGGGTACAKKDGEMFAILTAEWFCDLSWECDQFDLIHKQKKLGVWWNPNSILSTCLRWHFWGHSPPVFSYLDPWWKGVYVIGC